MNTLIKNGFIVDVFKKRIYKSDILITNGIISEISHEIISTESQVFDVSGKFVFPGFIDMHVHLREPGEEYKEDFEHALEAAISNGITSLLSMPNTNPVPDNSEIINKLLKKSQNIDKSKVFICASASSQRNGEDFYPFYNIRESIKAVSDDGNGINSESLIYRIFNECKRSNIPYLSHCETSGIDTHNEVSEELMVMRDIILAENTRSKLHIQHISTKKSAQYVKWAKENNIQVTAEVTPHHLFLDNSKITETGEYKMNPPLRDKENNISLISALKKGIIDVIASDHAPHTIEQKNKSYIEAPFGVSGLDTIIKVSFNELYYKNGFSLPEIGTYFTYNPAKILDLKKIGEIKKGNIADIAVMDIDRPSLIKREKIKSLGKNIAFDNYKTNIDILYTFVNGEMKWQKG